MRRFIVQLRLRNSLRYKLSTILKNEFGNDDGSARFKDFCDSIGVNAAFSSY